jgi:queuine tRNA-ribosyltransferase
VAAGVGTGVKKDTTVAVIAKGKIPTHYAWLDAAWLAKWERSQAKFPESLPESERMEFERAVRGGVGGDVTP